jgi:hypothetical protein
MRTSGVNVSLRVDGNEVAKANANATQHRSRPGG